MIQPEELVGGEWAEWYRLTPVQRWLESEKLWQTYLALGGSLDPEPDTQSPFFDARAASAPCLWAVRRACFAARPSLAATQIWPLWPMLPHKAFGSK
ncbi:MAG TPA: hypothetical protein VK846_12785 [Candidatus Limnocylindria bacterium]|nr:hypothetical protein [Candidatus Limnocylindria bacterium]